ncbi:hypothetical protein [Microvirga pudoricolor]|uniref:hypothetical protein n=1 Tax=Microvirga pudoricolor TaxID=2778729 RepID=UPI00195178FA|nr:hypothetical protein [Microvirga pudoricolor]MBM6595843.1 hypothetical protein [Microvirga pudoricolor]
MGERSLKFKRFASKHPSCCYCGGVHDTTEIDHMPPRNMFEGKARPNDFVFPACADCNRLSSLSESVCTMLFRTKAFVNNNRTHDDELERVIRDVSRNDPDVLTEMFFHDPKLLRKKMLLQRELGTGDFDILAIGPITRTYIYNFCAKMGLAAHYKRTGLAVPRTGIVISDVRIGPEYIKGEVPDLNYLIEEEGTLRQGQWSVWNQFAYRFAQTEKPDIGLYQFIFHDNALVTCVICHDKNLISVEYPSELARTPGELFLSPGRFPDHRLPIKATGYMSNTLRLIAN